MNDVDKRLKLARIGMGLSQRQLAAQAGCAENLISRIETGRVRPDSATAERIAKLLNKRPWEIGL